MGIYTLSKSARWQLAKGRIALPVDRPTVIFMTIEPPVDRPVDRKLKTENRALCRSTGLSTRAIFREQKLSGGRPTRSTGLPAKTTVHVRARRSTGAVDRLLRRSTVRSTGRRQVKLFLGIKNLGILTSIKSHKIT